MPRAPTRKHLSLGESGLAARLESGSLTLVIIDATARGVVVAAATLPGMRLWP